MSAALTGKSRGPRPPEVIERIRQGNLGKVRSAETRARTGAAKKGRTLSPEHRQKISAGNRGRTRSDDTRARMRIAQHGHVPSRKTLEAAWAASRGRVVPEDERQRAAERQAKWISEHPGTRMTSKPERIMVNLLRAAGFTVETQRHFGRACVDAYLPDYHVAFEADGAYWHNRPGAPEKDAARDAELMRRFALPVVRLGEFELRDIGAALPHLAA